MKWRVKALGLPAGDYALHGSAPMLAHGLLSEIHDIDIVARGTAWERATTLGEIGRAASGGDRLVRLPGEIELFDGWLGEDRDALIDGAIWHHGLPLVRLGGEEVLRFKRRLNRAKDHRHYRVAGGTPFAAGLTPLRWPARMLGNDDADNAVDQESPRPARSQ